MLPDKIARGNFPWVSFYALVGKLCLLGLQDKIMDMIRLTFEKSRKVMNPCWAKEIYLLTQSGCGSRKYCVNSMAEKYETMWKTVYDFMGLIQENHDFASDSLVRLTQVGTLEVIFVTTSSCAHHCDRADDQRPARIVV